MAFHTNVTYEEFQVGNLCNMLVVVLGWGSTVCIKQMVQAQNNFFRYALC